MDLINFNRFVKSHHNVIAYNVEWKIRAVQVPYVFNALVFARRKIP